MNDLDETLKYFAIDPRPDLEEDSSTEYLQPEDTYKYRRAGFFSSAFSAAARGASPRGITSISDREYLDYMFRKQIFSRIFRPVFEVGLRVSVGLFQERITTLWTVSPMKVGTYTSTAGWTHTSYLIVCSRLTHKC